MQNIQASINSTKNQVGQLEMSMWRLQKGKLLPHDMKVNLIEQCNMISLRNKVGARVQPKKMNMEAHVQGRDIEGL